MGEQIRAIDLLFHCTARRQFEHGLSCYRTPALSLAAMDSAGVERAFVSQCKKWSCERQWMCVDTRLEDVLSYTRASARFVGLAGYNPFDIAESVREVELAVAEQGFRGIFVHAASFGLRLIDARMYPLFAKAAELGVPVLAEVESVSAESLLREELCRLAEDFADLVLVLVPSRPAPAEIIALAAAAENICFALDPGALAHLARAIEAADFFSGPLFQQRCMWGSNGVAWPDALRACQALPLLPDAATRFLRDNAMRVFALDRPLPSRAPRSAMKEILAAER